MSIDLPMGTVHVWHMRLDDFRVFATESQVLSMDELDRASRFHFVKDRLHFVRCRSALRLLLGQYLQIPATEVRFAYQSKGKPEVVQEQNQIGLRFNVSHSGNMALLSFAVDCAVGIDIERIESKVDISTLIRQFFSFRERSELLAMPSELLLEAFFACWTRKEAFLKAVGEGLGRSLQGFSVTTHPHLHPRLELPEDRDQDGEWFLSDIRVPEGYRAAVAIRGRSPIVRNFVERSAGSESFLSQTRVSYGINQALEKLK